MTPDHVVLLGTKGGPAIRPGSAMPTSHLLCLDGRRIVVDCGLGVTRALVDQGMALQDLSLIFVSHLHSDHYLELGPLIHTAWTAGLSTVVDIHGPPGIDSTWQAFVISMQADIDLRIVDEGRPDLRDLVRVHLIEEGIVLQDGGLTVTALRNDHPPLVDSFALSFRTARRHVVFSGDTAPLPRLAEFARDADLLVHEAMLTAALPALTARVGNGSDRLMAHLLRSHTPAEDAARTATLAGARCLALSHLIPADDPAYGVSDWQAAVAPHYTGRLVVGRDGLRIDLADRT